MARGQPWTDRIPADDASRRGEQRRLLVELELDDAVLGRADQRGGYYPATTFSTATSAAGLHDDPRTSTASARGTRRSHIEDGRQGRRPWSPHGLASPESSGRQLSSRLSSPFKLKQTVLSSRRGSAGADDDYHDDHRGGRADRRGSSRPGGGQSSERGRQRRLSSGASRASQASPTALVQDAIRQNMALRDQVLDQLRSLVLPPAVAVERTRTPDLGVSSALVRELNRLRTLSLAVVEMVVYLYSEHAAGDKKHRSNADRTRRLHSRGADEQDDDADAEALEQEFLPYLLRMAAADTDFLAFNPGLQRFFDAQSVRLSRNPLLDGLSLDASELLLCSCHYVSASAPSALFNSGSALASSSSSSSLFQLLTHKLEAFALQTERYLTGWQVLPSVRVAAVLLHLLELETRSNATRLLPTYLRPSRSRESSITAAGSKSTSTIGPRDPPSVWKATELTALERAESNADLRRCEVKGPLTPPHTSGRSAVQAWDTPATEPKPTLPPVVEPMPQPVAAEQTAALSASYGDHTPATSEAKPTGVSSASTRAFKKGGGGRAAQSPHALAPVAQQLSPCDLHASSKGCAGSPLEPAAHRQPTQQQSQARGTHESAADEANRGFRPPSKVASGARTATADSSITASAVKVLPDAPTIPGAAVEGGASFETEPRSSGRDARLQRVSWQAPIVPPLSLHMIPASVVKAEGEWHSQASPDDDGKTSSNRDLVMPRAWSGNDNASARPSPHTPADMSAIGIGARTASAAGKTATTAEEEVFASDLHGKSARSCSSESAYSSRGASFEPSTTRSDLSTSTGTCPSRSPSARAQRTPQSCSKASGEGPTALPSTHWSQQAGQDAAELPPSSSVACEIAKALDMLPRFDFTKAGTNLKSEEEGDVGTGSSNSTPDRFRSPSDDEDGVEIDQGGECQALLGARATVSAKTRRPLSTRSEPSRQVPLESLCGAGGPAKQPLDTPQEVGVDALGRIFDLCQDVQVAAYDLGHRFSRLEVDQRSQFAMPHFHSPASPPLAKSVSDQSDAPRYLERELKVLRRYLASWRDNAHQQRAVKRKLQLAAAHRTVQRFGVRCATSRREALAMRRLERQVAAARVLEKAWAAHAYRVVVGHRSNDFHLVHKCFRRLRFFAGTSKRKRRRVQAKETIVRWWRRWRARCLRVKKRQDALRRQRERREGAARIIKQAIREWVLRRRLAKTQAAARQAAFKENLKRTKAKREHEETLLLEHRRQAQWTSMMKATLAELEGKWKQAEGERVALEQRYAKVVERHQRTIDKKRREIAAHRIHGFLAACALQRKLRAVEATRSDTDKQLRALSATTRQSDQETQRRRQKMRLEQRLLEKKLAKAERQMARASAAHERDSQARKASERQLQHELARRTIKAFVDRRCLETRARLHKHQQLTEQQRLRDEKRETEAMAAEELHELSRGARIQRTLLEDRLAEVHREAEHELASRDQLLKTKDDHVQRVERQRQQDRADASRSRVSVWLTQQVRVARMRKQAEAALADATRAVEVERRRQEALVASQSREVATLKIGAFVTSRVDRMRSQRHEAAAQRQQAEVYAKELVTEQRLRSFVVEMVIAVKLQSESEAHRAMASAVRGVHDVLDAVARRRARLRQLWRATSARAVQRSWRRWRVQQQRKREEHARRIQRVDAVRQRGSACRIQKWWRQHRTRRAKREAEREERERKSQRVELVKRRESARRMQQAWRRFAAWRREQAAERGRKLTRLDVVRRRESARHIQTAWQQHCARKRRRVRERERTRLRVEGVRRRECARRIQVAWLASVKRKRQAREVRERRLRVVRFVQRRESAKQIQTAWRAHVLRRRAQLERTRRLKERVRSIRTRESARKIQSAWRRVRLQRRQQQLEKQRRQQELEELERRRRRVDAAKQRESARKIAVVWRTAKLRQYQLQQEREELERRRQRVAAAKERECARQIQSGWRQHSGERRRQQEAMDMRVLRVDAVRRRECARHIQSGWRRHSQDRQQEIGRAEEAYRQRMDRRLGEIRSGQCARVVQRNWRAWRQQRDADAMRAQCLLLIRTRQAARSIQSQWRYWRRARQASAARHARLCSIRMNICGRVIQRNWRRRLRVQESRRLVEEQLALIRRRCAAKRIQCVWRRWRRLITQRSEQATRRFACWVNLKRSQRERQALVATHNISATRIQRVYRRWKKAQALVASPSPREDEAAVHGEVVEMTKRVCGRRIVRAWRRFRNVNQFAAATHIGAVWRGRYARQAYALALASKRSRDERLEEIRLSILAVRVQRCYQDWRVRMRRRKRAEMLARESELIARAKRQAKLQSSGRREPAADDAQKGSRAFSSLESDCKPDMAEPAEATGETDHEARANVGVVVERWVIKELPYILTTGMRAVLTVDTAAAVIQRLSRRYLRRAQLWFHANRPSIPTAPGSASDAPTAHELRCFFKHARAWLEWRRPGDLGTSSTHTLRLRFEAQVTRKLLVMLDRQAHSVDEIRHAITELTTDALPIFTSDECLRSHEAAADRRLAYHDVGELELPHFCVLTRSMGKIRSMHRRKQHSASFTSMSESPSQSPPVTPKAASSRPRCSRVQSLSVFEAVENASVEDAMFLEALGEDLGAVEPKMLRNALHLLTFSTENYRFRLEMLDFLLENGKADVNAMDINGESPSMLFAAHGHLEFLSRMARHGADLQLTDKSGRNVLHRACEEDQVEVVTFLHRSGLPVPALDLHVPDQNGCYPLHIVVSKGLAECAKQLLSNDAASSWVGPSLRRWEHVLQLNRDRQGRTALHLAVISRDTAMVSLLLAHGGEHVVNECDGMRRSPVHFAVETSPSLGAASPLPTATDALAVLTLLIEYGANTSIGDERGDTPLHWAAFAGNVALARFLVARGADLTAVNSDWETPGQVAAAYGHFACVKAMATSANHRRSRGNADPDVEVERSASERMLNDAVNDLAYQQASSQSYHIPVVSPTSTRATASVENHYWEEIHQEVQLVDESGRFSSEDESDGEDSADDVGL